MQQDVGEDKRGRKKHDKNCGKNLNGQPGKAHDLWS